MIDEFFIQILLFFVFRLLMYENETDVIDKYITV